MPTEQLTIDVVSDVVCPWCLVGKVRLERAIALRPDVDVTVRWHPYFLNPWVPREGMAREQYLTTKFGSVERYEQIAKRLVEAGAQDGIAFAFDKMQRQPNTLDCHRLILWAGEDKAGKVKRRLMELYFIEGADLTDRETLLRAAEDCGLDRDNVKQRLESEEDVETVERAATKAQQSGIDGVPFFILGGALAVSGAQAPEDLANAMDRVIAQANRKTASEVQALT